MPNDFLRKQVVSGLRWTAFTRSVTQLFTWSATLLVMRFLTPTDYGLVAMATIVSSYLMLLGEMGLSVALIQRPDLDLTTKRSVFGFLLLSGLVLFVTAALLTPLASRYFAEPQLMPLILIVAVQFLLIPFTVIPQANLSTEMRFAALGTTALISGIVSALATLCLAYFGFGAYALVAGSVILLLSKAIMLNVLAPFLHWPLLNVHAISSFATFSRSVLIQRTIWYWHTEVDTIIVGSFFGAASLGLYSVAKQLATMLFERFAEIMSTVATPAYSSVQKDLPKVRDMFIKTLRLSTMVAFPTFWGLALAAPEVVGLVLGNKWLAAVPLLQLLCISMPVQTLGSLSQTMLTAIGRQDVSLRCVMWSAGLVSCALLAGSYWGAVGIAAGWAIGYPIAFALNSIRVSNALGISVERYLRPLAKPLVCAALMVVVTSAITMIAPLGESRVFRLSVVTITGAVVFIGITLTIARAEAREFFKFGRLLLKR